MDREDRIKEIREALGPLVREQGDIVVEKLGHNLDIRFEQVAMRALNQFTPHDLTTHEGREELRRDMRFAHSGRMSAEEAGRVVRYYIIRGLLILSLALSAWFVSTLDHIRPWLPWGK